MSVLLRQPHGCEGLGVIPGQLQTNEPSVADRVEAGHLQVQVRTVAYAMPHQPHYDSVANVDEITDRFQSVGIPGVADVQHLLHDSLSPHLRPRLRPTVRVSQDRVGVEQFTPGIHVPGVPRLDGGSHYVDVLLRHRPRSIPQAQESA